MDSQQIFLVYDACSTVVRGAFSKLENAQEFIKKGISETGELFEESDVTIYSVLLDRPMDIGYTS